MINSTDDFLTTSEVRLRTDAYNEEEVREIVKDSDKLRLDGDKIKEK